MAPRRAAWRAPLAGLLVAAGAAGQHQAADGEPAGAAGGGPRRLEGPAAQAAAAAPGRGPALASLLKVQTEEDSKLHFALPGKRFSHPGEKLFKDGAAADAFRCGGGADYAAYQATEPGNYAVRRLVLGLADASVGLLEALTPSWASWAQGGAQDRSVGLAPRVTARVVVLEADQGVTTLRAALDAPLEGVELDKGVGLAVLYDCWREGFATVELRLALSGQANGTAAPASEEVCISWKKACTVGWGGLVVHEGAPGPGQSVAFKDGVVREDWRAAMATEGTHDTLTKLQLSVPGGVVRLRPPRVAVSDSSVLHAGFVFPEPQDFEVAASPVEMSVRHQCLADGAANVTLTLEMAVLSDEHTPVRAALAYKVTCGDTAYRHLHVFHRGSSADHKIQLVSQGVALSGFRRPCKDLHGAACIEYQTALTDLVMQSLCGHQKPTVDRTPAAAGCDAAYTADVRLALANGMFGLASGTSRDCGAWCLYDVQKPGTTAYGWTADRCWLRGQVGDGGPSEKQCFGGSTASEQKYALDRSASLCQAEGEVKTGWTTDGAECAFGELALEVPSTDIRTVLEMSLDKEGLIEPPAIQPPPDLFYDRRVLQATIQLNPGGANAVSRPLHTRSSFQTLSVRYTCFKDGVTDIMLTLHVLAHKPIELAWRKRCVEPKARVGKALTAPQALAIVMVVLVAMGGTMCLICICCSEEEEDRDGVFGGKGRKVAVGSRHFDEEEALQGMGHDGVRPAAIGAPRDEVSWH